MRYLLIILSLLSFSFSQLLPSDEDIAKMSYFEKQMLYDRNDKNPILAVGLNFVIPTLGHAYIDDWKTGLIINGAQFCLLVLAFNTDPYYVGPDAANDSISIISYLGVAALYIYQFLDVYIKSENYNMQLHNKIFQKDNNLSFLILPTSNGAYLNLSYKF
tara:strand:+ start:133 stop:612 length:480 start_codon:yes stop_codon:yes gene_type:complete